MYSGQSRAERVHELTDQLEQGMEELVNGEQYTAYLKAMSKFHQYSAGNIMLILQQCPTATYVAGFHTWKKDLGRSVKKGEIGIKILAPLTYKTDEAQTEEEKEVCGFRVVSVFDISQTEGKELPELGGQELTESVEGYENLFRALKTVSPIPVIEEELEEDTESIYKQEDQVIAYQPGMSEAHTIEVVVHEIAHAKMHALPVKDGKITGNHEINKKMREVQAESVAYVVCQHFGIDTSSSSLGYIASWSKEKELKELKESLAAIRSTAAELIDGIESHMQNKTLTRKPRRKHLEAVR